MVMDRTLPLANGKAHLSEIVDQVESGHDRVILTRNGRPAAVILSPDDLEALEETLDLLSRPGGSESRWCANSPVTGRLAGEPIASSTRSTKRTPWRWWFASNTGPTSA